jgi:hypothetical protein
MPKGIDISGYSQAKVLAMPREECKIGLMKLEDCSRVGQAVWERFGALAPE